MARSRKTQRFDEAASGVLRRADRSGKRFAASAVNTWSQVVGNDIAAHTKGFALRENGELVVFVDSGAWANQLSLMSSELLERLNRQLGDAAVRSLRFTVSRKVKEGTLTQAAEEDTDEFYSLDTTEPEPLTDVERAQAAAIASAVKDEGLRDLALKVMIKDLELKKGKRVRSGTSDADTGAS